MNVSIERLTENDWREFAQIRLRALETDPQVFGSNYEREARFVEDDWRTRLRAKDNAIFLIRENKKSIGITCVSLDRNDPTGKTALLWGSWLAPEFRRKGLSELMYRTRLEWAKRQPTVEKVIVSHRASNLASMRANRKHGFVVSHKIENFWNDGSNEDLISCELKIQR